MAFEWHSAKAKSNLEKYGVSFEEASSVFNDPLQLHYPDEGHSIEENRYICLGMSDSGRLLLLVYVERLSETFRIISAPEMTRRERKIYEAQRDIS